ncbi:MAG: hypothetical protein K9W43_12875 [Candidatus Thorarchaeota archaeon]|nr:hypothetical protein [Candidatus Thorarchaeota archaeon]
MKLGTIGSVLKFAIRFESTLQKIVEQIHYQVTTEKEKTIFKELRTFHVRRVDRLKRLQRENTTEMILEPIVGLSSDQYEISETIEEKGTTHLISLLQEAEKSAHSFYKEATMKVEFLPEIADVFEEFKQEFDEFVVPHLSK